MKPDQQAALTNRLCKAISEEAGEEQILACLAGGADINGKDARGETPLHYAAARDTASLRLLLKMGAKAGSLGRMAQVPLCEAAAFGKTDNISLLLQYMTPEEVNHRDKYGMSAVFHVFSLTQPHEALVRLLDGGTNPAETHIAPYHMVRSLRAYAEENTDKLACAIIDVYLQTPLLDGIVHAQLFNGTDETMQHPVFWHRFAKTSYLLESAGTPITKADLLTPYQGRPMTARHKPLPYLARAAECACLQPVMEYLNARGEQITTADLLTEGDTPNDLLHTIIRHQALQHLFSPENWKGQSPGSLRRLWHALPPEAREQVTNYRQLAVECSAGWHNTRSVA